MKLLKLSDNMIYDVEAGIQYTRKPVKRYDTSGTEIIIPHVYAMDTGGGEDRGLDFDREEAETLWRYLEAVAIIIGYGQ